MGLANRVVPDGTARAAAEALAAEIARFPQACLRADRLSALEQAGLSVEEAMRNEFRARCRDRRRARDARGGVAFCGRRGPARHVGPDLECRTYGTPSHSRMRWSRCRPVIIEAPASRSATSVAACMASSSVFRNAVGVLP